MTKPTGRPKGRPPIKEPLAREIKVLFTEEDAARVEAQAAAEGLPVSAWIRRAALVALSEYAPIKRVYNRIALRDNDGRCVGYIRQESTEEST